jgi:hypothetical protein
MASHRWVATTIPASWAQTDKGCERGLHLLAGISLCIFIETALLKADEGSHVTDQAEPASRCDRRPLAGGRAKAATWAVTHGGT